MSITSIDYIKELAHILNSNNLTKIDISAEGSKIVLEQPKKGTSVVQKMQTTESKIDLPSVPKYDEVQETSSYAEIKSPIVGVFYSAPSPDTEDYVNIGDNVKKGDVLCIIEAMKLLNEITADRDGKIIDICLKNGDVAEFGQVLFKIV